MAKSRINNLMPLTAIVLWALSYLWNDRLIKLGIPISYFVSIHILLAGIILLIYNIIVGNDIRIKKKHRKWFLLLAFLEPFTYFICEAQGLKLTNSPTFSALIIATNPIFATIAGTIIFREKLNLFNIIGMIVCIFGVILVTANFRTEKPGSTFAIGAFLLLIAIFASVGQDSCVKHISSEGSYKTGVIVMYQFLFGALMLLPILFTKGMAGFDAKLYFSWDVISAILCLTILCSCVAFSLWVSTVKILGVAKSSIFLSTTPVVTALAGWLLGTEILSATQWSGIGTTCLGVIASQYVVKKSSKRIKN